MLSTETSSDIYVQDGTGASALAPPSHAARLTEQALFKRQDDELFDLIKIDASGDSSLDFIIANMNCAGCMAKIEHHFSKLNNELKSKLSSDLKCDLSVRVNLSQRVVHFKWFKANVTGAMLLAELSGLGFQARPLLADEGRDDASSIQVRKLLWALGVAGFAAANVMLLSVSIWSGAEGTTRDFFHWLSALIALPAIAFAGQPFFHSAFTALKNGRLNMDVPISLAVVLAAGLSLYETFQRGDHAFFDAALTLLFFLLIGRTLDMMMRQRAFRGVRSLLAFKSSSVLVVDKKGHKKPHSISNLSPGMIIFVHPGETIPVDGVITDGQSDVDWSLLNGEALPKRSQKGDEVFSGLINLSGPLTIRVEAVGEQTILADIIRLMETAKERAPRYRQLADRAASYYAPLVHLAAALTFFGWLAAGSSVEGALYISISVLIITCPCALGLAVPVVQVVASSIAHKNGILMKDGQALEKLSEIDTVVFDKTGTLTVGTPRLKSQKFDAEFLLPAAASLAANSLHPLSKALHNYHEVSPTELPVLTDIEEHGGLGLRALWQGGELRLGSSNWCGIDEALINSQNSTVGEAITAGCTDDCLEDCLDDYQGGYDLTLWASFASVTGERYHAQFIFEDELRTGAVETIKHLSSRGVDVIMLSGDRQNSVARLAKRLRINQAYAEKKPAEKCKIIERLGIDGRKVLMVGDGINDGPCLRAAHVSLSPSSASDVAQVSAGFVLMRESLRPLIGLLDLAHHSKSLIHLNFALAVIYNLIAVPIAIAGFVTPIVAAVAMSFSSILVTGNALRLHRLSKNKEGQI